jgi:hypothetical protein
MPSQRTAFATFDAIGYVYESTVVAPIGARNQSSMPEGFLAQPFTTEVADADR